jgi:serine/threonine-protein kinase
VPEAATAAVQAGLVLGRYRPLRPLGSGGSGSVWLARDEQTGLDVALKIVAREGKAAPRAEREAAAAARLRHERCLRAYALAHDDGHVYIAYEYVAGRTLREALRAGEVDDRCAVEVAGQVLDALGHAHARGIVHRDVKPSNVLLADGPGVSVRLLDFGLARIEEAETLTAAGDVPGTLAYISPERLVAGEQGSWAGDVWAVGVMLWEALAGEHPFWRPSVLECARAVEAGAPPLASVRPDLPKPLLAAADSALSLDPARRPTAAKLATALRESTRRRERVHRPRLELPAVSWQRADRAAPASLAAIATAATTAALPFFPTGWPVLLAGVAAATTALRPRAGLVLTLAAPLLPLGNVSLGLAFAYAAVAAAWLALFAGDPRSGLLPALGLPFGPLGALGLLPLAVLRVRSTVHRGVLVAAGVLLAAVGASVRGSPLPLTAADPTRTLGIGGVENPLTAANAVWHALTAQGPLLLVGLALAAAAALLPHARSRGPWGLAAWGGALLAAALLPAPEVAAAPIVLATWVTFAVMVAVARH